MRVRRSRRMGSSGDVFESRAREGGTGKSLDAKFAERGAKFRKGVGARVRENDDIKKSESNTVGRRFDTLAYDLLLLEMGSLEFFDVSLSFEMFFRMRRGCGAGCGVECCADAGGERACGDAGYVV